MSLPIRLPDESDGDLFDFQVNGFAGVDFQRDDLSPAEVRHAVDTLRRHGAGRCFATLITDSIDRLCRKLERLEQIRAADETCRGAIAGYHLEGPWISAEDGYRGAHSAALAHAPRPGEFQLLQTAAGGGIRLVTLAPELPGCDTLIADLVHQGVHVSLGHTDATERAIDVAIAAGARFCTHLGNATPLTLPRHDNVVQRLLARDELTACFIPDGWHVPAPALKNFFRAKPAGRVLFTTDAMAAAGAGPGSFSLGTMRIVVGADGVARQPDGSGFAGSTLAPAEGVRRTARFLGLPLATAHRYWSTAAAEAFGLAAPAISP